MSENSNIFDSMSKNPIGILLGTLVLSVFFIFYGNLSSHNPGIEAKDKLKMANAYIATASQQKDIRVKDSLLAIADIHIGDVKYRKHPYWYASKAFGFMVKGKLDSAYLNLRKAKKFNDRQKVISRELVNFMNFTFSRLAITYINNGINDNAFAIANEGLAVSPKNSDLFNVKGVYYTRKGNLDSALANFQKAIQFNPNNNAAKENLFNLFVGQANKGFKENNMQYAISMLWNAEKIAPKNENVLLLLGKANINIGDAKTAAYYLNKVIAVNPNNQEANNLLRRLSK